MILLEEHAKTERSLRDLKKQIAETNKSLAEHGRRTDERIATLVSAIGEFIRRTERTKAS